MDYRALHILVLLTLISGCAHQPRKGLVMPQRRAMTEVYQQSVNEGRQDAEQFIAQNLKEQGTFGYVQPYMPVIEPPVVRKVWVPDHQANADQGVLVSGHWVYVMLEAPKWNLDHSKALKTPAIIVPGKPASAEVSTLHN